MNNAWAHRALRATNIVTQRFEAQDAVLNVLVDEASLGHHGEEKQSRPYLHLGGSLLAVRPKEALSYDIDELTFDLGHAERIDAYYEFDDAQLVELVRKGYFSPGFQAPADLVDVEWELPATVDVLILAPSGEGPDNAPSVFVDVKDAADLRVDLQSSSYDAAYYFEDYSRSGAEHEGSVVSKQPAELSAVRGPAPALDRELKSLFTEEQMQSAGLGEHALFGQQASAEVPNSILDDRMAELDENVREEREALKRERSLETGSVQNLYDTHVSASLLEDEALVEIEAQAEEVQEAAEEEVVAQGTTRSLAERVMALRTKAADQPGADSAKASQPEAGKSAAEAELARRVAQLTGKDDAEHEIVD